VGKKILIKLKTAESTDHETMLT